MIMNKEFLYVTNGGCQTLMAYMNEIFPSEYGNRISYGRRDLINLNAENLNYLLEKGIISYPIKLEIVDDLTLLAVDERIPPDFLINWRDAVYEEKQKMTQQFTVTGEGYTLLGYKGEEIWTDGIIYCPFMPINEKVV